MNKVYGIFSGEYSDWAVHGFLTNKEEAMKYCAFKNSQNYEEPNDVYNYGNYYTKELSKIYTDVQKIELRYYHEVVFDYNYTTDQFVMRNEPDRFDYYTGKSKPMKLVHNMESCNWVSVELEADSRKHAEKIAQDLVARLQYAAIEMGSMKDALATGGFINWNLRNTPLSFSV